MSCPKCNAEMMQGYLQTARPLFWSPKKRALVPWTDSESIIFSMSLISGTNIATYHCPSCKIFLTQYSDEDIR